MRAYEVTAFCPTTGKAHIQFGGSQSDAKAKQKELVELLVVKKKDVEIKETEIPTSKSELLEFLNELLSSRV